MKNLYLKKTHSCNADSFCGVDFFKKPALDFVQNQNVRKQHKKALDLLDNFHIKYSFLFVSYLHIKKVGLAFQVRGKSCGLPW
jgi:hypothetical protein